MYTQGKSRGKQDECHDQPVDFFTFPEASGLLVLFRMFPIIFDISVIIDYVNTAGQKAECKETSDQILRIVPIEKFTARKKQE